jgi:predicted signal transduction protein with EAL and GGDEF domain
MKEQVQDKETRVVMLLPESLKRRFKIACVAQGVEMSAQLRGLVEAWLEKPDKK